MTPPPDAGATPIRHAPREVVDRCLACGSTAVAESFAAPAQMGPPEEDFRFSTCGDCGLLYLSERVRPDQVHRYYDESYLPHRGEYAWGRFASFVGHGQVRQDRARVSRVADLIEPTPTDRVLDVGCGRPTFLRELREKTGVKAIGVDFRLDAFLDDPEFDGVELRSGDPREVRLDGTFSAITMWHYLEHDYDPVATLRALLPHTTPDTVLLIELPDARSRARAWSGNRWAGLHTPRHTAIYTPDTMRRLLDEAGWRVIADDLRPTLDPWVLWWLSWRERRGTDWAGSMAPYLPEFVLGGLFLGPWLRMLSNDVLLVAARPG